MSSIPTPASSRRRTASAIAPRRSRSGSWSVPSSSEALPPANGLSVVRASSHRLVSSRRMSSRSPPTCALSSSGVPSAISFPWSITAIRSDKWSASSRYWVVRRTVVPLETSTLIPSQSVRRLVRSRPVVGSSRKRTGGRATSAPARSSRRRMPPEYVRTSRSPASVRSKSASSSRARSRETRLPRWYRRPNISRFSKPLKFSSTAAYWPARPIRARSLPASLTTSKPATRAVPPSGARRVVRMRTAVVLPAPLGPRSPRMLPASTRRSTSSRATTSP